MRPITHSRVTHGHMVEYLDEIVARVSTNAAALTNSQNFKAVYKNSLAAFVTLKVFSNRQLLLLRIAAELCRRTPILLVDGQVSEATASLRRFVEIIAWFPYFDDHPVEWAHLQKEPSLGYTRFDENPIAYAAHREIAYYFAYIVEKSECDSGSILARAIADLKIGFIKTSSAVHAGVLAAQAVTVDPFDKLSPEVLKAFGDLQRSIFRAGLIVASWSLPEVVHRLPAVERSWFDWLLKEWAHAARSGELA
jgi:hypothetical protein